MAVRDEWERKAQAEAEEAAPWTGHTRADRRSLEMAPGHRG